ncbi:ATP-dependent Clp protease ATP-binding subunit [Treponema sp.]|uniref:ATP-dependent Clp protease ATP-binding subunit n=1 Tax=Treponema sp. TaxID=166 RepID=UPI0025ECCB1C|nr:ATP-dependent Clp protease ATP-binding subunit [Treponema sp.]MCR5219121.1 ATP-dependent Clp protease ATP-binding subunit [Treponema sp.]
MINLNFSPRAKRLLVALAPDEAYKLGSTTLEPEHLILALLKSGDGLGYITLRTLRMNVLTLQLAIEQSMTAKIADIEVYDLPQSQRLKNVLELAQGEALRSNLSYIGTEHFLLGAVCENPSLMNNYFKKAGITYDQLRSAVADVEKKVPSSARIDSSFKPGIPGADGELLMSDGSSRRKANANSVLETFSRDLTRKAQEDEADPVIGRGNEIQRLIQILSRRQKNNPILVGEPGVGKTAVVEGLAARIVKGMVPKNLLDKRVLCLDLAAMIAGTKYRGEFEERMKRVMKEISESKNVILFIDEIHTIIGAGGPEGSMDASNMMKPALSRGEIQVIGATTSKEYRKYFEKDSALARRFQKIVVNEPDQIESIAILQGLKRKYEEFHNVIYDDDVIPAIVKYSARYISERYLPDKAIDVLDEAGAAKKILDDERPEEFYEIEKNIQELVEEKSLLVQQQDYEKAALIRDKVGQLKHRLDEVNREWKNSGNSNAKHVTLDDVLSIISLNTGIDVEQLDDGESHRLVKMEDYIHQTVIGQDDAVKLICSAVRRNRAGVSSVKRPIGSFIFLGPTGVGKTQLAKTLAKFLFGTEDALIRVDMSDYMEKHNASRLVGAPPGYIGYDEGGTLTEKVRQHPYSVVLLDEIEKAHSDIFNLLLQMLEEGELSDNLGHTISFRNTIVIMTSNAGARNIMAENRMGFSTSSTGVLPYEDIKSSAMEELKRIMTPELLNRVDDIVVFNPLDKKQIDAILNIQLRELELRLGEQDLSLCIKPKAREYLIEHGYDPSMGARPLRRLIEREIEDELATLILSGKRGSSATVMVDYNGEKLTVKFKKEKHENKTQQALLVENV